MVTERQQAQGRGVVVTGICLVVLHDQAVPVEMGGLQGHRIHIAVVLRLTATGLLVEAQRIGKSHGCYLIEQHRQRLMLVVLLCKHHGNRCMHSGIESRRAYYLAIRTEDVARMDVEVYRLMLITSGQQSNGQHHHDY